MASTGLHESVTLDTLLAACDDYASQRARLHELLREAHVAIARSRFTAGFGGAFGGADGAGAVALDALPLDVYDSGAVAALGSGRADTASTAAPFRPAAAVDDSDLVASSVVPSNSDEAGSDKTQTASFSVNTTWPCRGADGDQCFTVRSIHAQSQGPLPSPSAPASPLELYLRRSRGARQASDAFTAALKAAVELAAMQVRIHACHVTE
jgi:hypothetical protein